MARNKVFIVLLALLVFRILLASVIPVTGDEAYFAEWARHPDLCYYDHPGMVAWIMYPSFALFGESLLSLRFQAVCAGILFAALAYSLGARMYPGTRIPFRGLLLAGLVPFSAVLSVLVSTDTPLTVFWTGALVSFYAACTKNRLSLWILTGALAGCAFLSKFLAFGFLPAAFLYLLIAPGKRKLLKTPGPWAALAAAGVMFIPVLVWNYRNDWLTFSFNFVRRQGEMGFSWSSVLSYIGGQLLFFSPFAVAVPAVYVIRNVRACLRSEQDLFLAVFAAVPLGGFLCISFLRPVGGHWTAVALVPLVLLCARALESRGTGQWKTVLYSGWGLSLFIVLVSLAVLIMGPRPLNRNLVRIGIAPDKAEWYTGIVFGNQRISSHADALRLEHDGFCATGSYSLSSVLTFHSSSNVHYYVWGSASFYGRNYDLWDDMSMMKGRTMIYTGFRTRIDAAFVQKMLSHFSSLTMYSYNHSTAEDIVKHLGESNISGVCRSGPVELGAFVIITGKTFSGEELSNEAY